jgi:hypothetical protein
MKFISAAALLATAATSLATSTPARAQEDYSNAEIVVTGMRRQAEDYDESVPAVGLRRVADFAIQQVVVTGDTRDAARRHEEIYAMIRGAIDLARRREGIDLATGEMIVEPLTAENYRSLTLGADGRPDTNRTSFLVKTSLTGGDAQAALARIEAFIAAVPTVGRAEIRRAGDLTLSVVGPDQYRAQILQRVAADARATAAAMGPDYGVEATGLDRPVEWSRASLTEVFLYVPYRYTVVPAGR